MADKPYIPLKHCPFCGGRAELGIREGNYGYTPDIYYVTCMNCGARIERENGYTDCTTAVSKAWNTRHVAVETVQKNTYKEIYHTCFTCAHEGKSFAEEPCHNCLDHSLWEED